MRILIAAGALALGLLAAPSPQAAEGTAPPEQHWSFDGAFGTFDRAALQRGFQVYQGVCQACHSAHFLSFRNLGALGFSEDEVKAIAAQYTVTDGPNDQGEMFDRPGRPSDRKPSPYPNEQAARAGLRGACREEP